MPDPRDPTPVKAEQRGDSWTVVDKDGRTLPDAGSMDEEAAKALAAQVNSTWSKAKSDRKSAGSPSITEARVAARAERFRTILGL